MLSLADDAIGKTCCECTDSRNDRLILVKPPVDTNTFRKRVSIPVFDTGIRSIKQDDTQHFFIVVAKLLRHFPSDNPAERIAAQKIGAHGLNFLDLFQIALCTTFNG